MSAANETQVRATHHPNIMNQAVLRARNGQDEDHPIRHAVGAPPYCKTQFTSIVAPIGLVQHAVKKGAISGTTDDTGNKSKQQGCQGERKGFKGYGDQGVKKRKGRAAASGQAAVAA